MGGCPEVVSGQAHRKEEDEDASRACRNSVTKHMASAHPRVRKPAIRHGTEAAFVLPATTPVLHSAQLRLSSSCASRVPPVSVARASFGKLVTSSSHIASESGDALVLRRWQPDVAGELYSTSKHRRDVSPTLGATRSQPDLQTLRHELGKRRTERDGTTSILSSHQPQSLSIRSSMTAVDSFFAGDEPAVSCAPANPLCPPTRTDGRTQASSPRRPATASITTGHKAELFRRSPNASAEAAKTAMNSRFSDMRKAFQFADVDASGYLGKDELRRALDLWNVPINEDKLLNLLGTCDVDGDGNVSYSEFVNALARDTVSLDALQARKMAQPTTSFGPKRSEAPWGTLVPTEFVSTHRSSYKDLGARRAPTMLRPKLQYDWMNRGSRFDGLTTSRDAFQDKSSDTGQGFGRQPICTTASGSTIGEYLRDQSRMGFATMSTSTSSFLPQHGDFRRKSQRPAQPVCDVSTPISVTWRRIG